MNYINILDEIIKLDFGKIELIDFKSIDNTLQFTVQGKNKGCRCPSCGVRTVKRQDLSLYHSKRNLKHIVLSDNRMIEIKTIKRYFTCKKCNINFLERFEFEAKNGSHTKTFESFVIASWGYMSGCQIAKNTKSSPTKIHKILSNIDPSGLNKRGIGIMMELDEIYIGIDEHSFQGKDMILVITEIKNKQVLAILPDIKKETLTSWLKSIPIEIRDKIKGFSSDMNKGYRNTIIKEIGKKCYTVDKYHLVQEVNKMMYDVLNLNKWLLKMNFVKIDDIIKKGKVSKDLIRKTKKKVKKGNKKQFQKYKNQVDNILNPEYIEKDKLFNSKGNKIEFKEISLDYYINGPVYKTLFCMREKNMSGYQKLRLRQITRDFDYNNFLKEARVLKENFVDSLDEKNIEDITKIMNEALESDHYRLNEFGRTLRNWYDGIVNYCKYSTEDFHFTNAYTESINNQCKIAKRVSHGFRYKDNYFRKLTSRFSLKKSQKGK